MKQTKFKISNDDLFLFLKLSIFQFLTKNEISFWNKGNRIVFENFTNDKTNIQSEIFITDNLEISLTSVVAIKKDFLDISQLVKISNLISEFFNTFSIYIQEEENHNILALKEQIVPNENSIIDENFWYDKVSLHTNYISCIINFLFVDYPKSIFFKQEEINLVDLKMFISKSIEKYKKALDIINEQKSRGFEYLTKDELELDIQKELFNLQKGNGNVIKLCLLYSAFQNKKDD